MPNQIDVRGVECYRSTRLRSVAFSLTVGLLGFFSSPPSACAQPTTWPGPRARHHLVFDPVTNRTVLLGGARDTTAWIWDGSTWQPMRNAWPARANYAAAYDSRRHRLIVHGGSARTGRRELDDTWETAGDESRLVDSAGPGARAHHGIVYDPVRRMIVLFGNSDNATENDTWGWDGQSWTLLAKDGPPRRGVYGLTFDTRRGVAVLFGGYGSGDAFLNDTWEWDGRRWRQVVTATSPSPRYDTQIVFDSTKGRVVLFGGQTRDGSVGDTWEYDGRNWAKLDVAGPSRRNGHAMVYDSHRKAVLLFGGRDGTTYLNDLWVFDRSWRQIQAR